MTNYIGLDIGGTEIKHGLLTSEGIFLAKGSLPTALFSTEDVPDFLARVKEIVQGYKSQDVAGVGIATAGIVDPVQGMVITGGPNKPGFDGLKLKEIVTRECGLPCIVENDVNAAGLGEFWLGSGRGASSLFCMTVGTGIGGCLIIDGKLINGATNSAGEVGNTFIGEPDIFENLASTTALIKEVVALKKSAVLAGDKAIFETIDGKKVFNMVEAGDKIAELALQHLVDRLAKGIANVCYIANPELVILGGGIMARKDYFGPRLKAALQKILLPAVFAGTRLEFAHLGNDAGMVGAVYEFMRKKRV